MMRLLACCILGMLVSFSSNACLNYYYTVDKEGHLHHADEVLVPFNINFNAKLNVDKISKLIARINEEHSYEHLSDYAVCLLKLGKHNEALEILKALYKYYPEEYKIVTNLGTAYEVNGDVESALRFIKLGIRLNPDSHEGSEWVHVRVLETKLALLKNPSYLNDHTVLALSEAQEKDSLVREQISVQIRERFPFTPGPDAIMASLLIDLGDCHANTKSVEFAKAVYEIAQKYYGDTTAVLSAKIKDMLRLIGKYRHVSPEQPRRSPATHIKLGGIRYKDLLQDNQIKGYAPQWEKIIVQKDSLLAMVDLTEAQQRLDSLTKLRADSLVAANKNNVTLQQLPEKKDNKLILRLVILLVVIGGYLLWRQFK